jgi:diguanylate cyclase
MARATFRDRIVGVGAGIPPFRWRRNRVAQKKILPHAETADANAGVRRDEATAQSRFALGTRHLAPILTTALLGGILSVVAWLVVYRWEERAIELEHSARANNVVLTLDTGIDEQFGKIAALRALFKASDRGVTRAEFDTYARDLTRGQAAILGVSWIPRVTREERAAHELAAVRDGLADYSIKSIAPDDTLTSAPVHDAYFPVYYIAKKEHPEASFGLDLLDGGLREDTLTRARDGNRLAASSIFRLQSGSGDRRGFFVLMPVYGRGLPQETIADRRRNIVGFVQGVFQLSTMIDSILGGLKTPMDLHIFEPGSGPTALPIHIHSSPLRTSPAPAKPLAALTAGPHWFHTLDVADLEWKLVITPIAAAGSVSHRGGWLMLFGGLLLTGLAVAFMWSSARYALRLVRANQKVSELAQTDTLTTLANRRAFVDRLTSTYAANKGSSSPFAVHYIDLDDFKDVNDTLGHSVGDNLLREAADRLRKIVRQDDLVARIGGDEFVVLQADAYDLAASATLAAKIIETLCKPYLVEGNEIHLTASVGISRYSPELKGPGALMIQADLALYRAKEDGRNCFRFHNKELDQRVRERVTMGEELRVAIERGALDVYYQPQVEIASGKIVGLEALARWNHPKLGLISPALFIPIAEKTGSINALGKWVFEEVCRQIRHWEDEGIAVPLVAVNLSAIQFKRPDLGLDIAKSLERWKVDPTKVEIELTESVLMEATKEHGDVVERIRKLGLKIAIDDFGTGYSPLNYLTRYPLDRLKIAQELVFKVTTDHRHATVVRTAIRLAEELGIEIIAEGVETAGQALFLVAAGCKYAQGFYFARPLDAPRVTELLRHEKIMPAEESKDADSLTAA